MTAFERLARARPRELEELVRSSPAPDLDAICGWRWRGYNTPAASRLLGIRKFIKVFERAPDGVTGYNLRARGTQLDEAWLARGPDPASRVGLYRVYPPSTRVGTPYPNAALIDYGAYPGQHWLVRAIRDHLVQPDPADPDVLLGQASFAAGPLLIPAGHFILGRLRALE